jgi:hypothetical protein
MDDLKSNGISMKPIEAGCVWQWKVVQKASKKNRQWSVFSTGGLVLQIC